jgi:hypothetical protein
MCAVDRGQGTDCLINDYEILQQAHNSLIHDANATRRVSAVDIYYLRADDTNACDARAMDSAINAF